MGCDSAASMATGVGSSGLPMPSREDGRYRPLLQGRRARNAALALQAGLTTSTLCGRTGGSALWCSCSAKLKGSIGLPMREEPLPLTAAACDSARLPSTRRSAKRSGEASSRRTTCPWTLGGRRSRRTSTFVTRQLPITFAAVLQSARALGTQDRPSSWKTRTSPEHGHGKFVFLISWLLAISSCERYPSRRKVAISISTGSGITVGCQLARNARSTSGSRTMRSYLRRACLRRIRLRSGSHRR